MLSRGTSEGPKMRILPDTEIKPFAACVPTELVRPHFYGTGALALVAEHNAERFLVVLRGEGVIHPTYINVGKDPGLSMLSYGVSYDVRLNHLEDLELGASKRWGQSGSIILHGNQKLMIVRSQSGMQGTAYYDLQLGQFVELNFPATVTAYRWKLVLTTAHKDFRPELFKFEAPSAV